MLDFLLTADVPAGEAMRAQARSVRVVCDGIEDPTFLILHVADPDALPIDVDVHAVLETSTHPAVPPQEVILFVREKRLAVLELVTYGQPMTRFPPIDALESPRAYAAPPPE